jgi:hypothetical protein
MTEVSQSQIPESRPKLAYCTYGAQIYMIFVSA